MNKSELIEKMVLKSNVAKKDTERVVKAFEEVVTEELAAGGKIQLVGFGTFEVAERKERIGRNPKTNEEMIIPAGKVPKFKAGKSLRESVKGE